VDRRVRKTPRIERRARGPKEGPRPGFASPATGERIPIWLANYVLPDYGSGAIMAVPAHDQRDLDFARQEGLPVRLVYVPEAGASGRTMTAPCRHDGLTRARSSVAAGDEETKRFVAWVSGGLAAPR
jgi:leucyl-tRNA synthetase